MGIDKRITVVIIFSCRSPSDDPSVETDHHTSDGPSSGDRLPGLKMTAYGAYRVSRLHYHVHVRLTDDAARIDELTFGRYGDAAMHAREVARDLEEAGYQLGDAHVVTEGCTDQFCDND